MADAEAISQLQAVLGGSCRHFHDLLVRGTLIGWSDVPITLITDLAATRAQIDAILADLRRYEVAAADCMGELATLQPLGLIVMEPALKEVEAFWTSNQYDAAVRILRSAYATKQGDPKFVQHYLRYCYLLGLRALILGKLPVAYDALQEVVHLDPGHLRAQELLRDIEDSCVAKHQQHRRQVDCQQRAACPQHRVARYDRYVAGRCSQPSRRTDAF